MYIILSLRRIDKNGQQKEMSISKNNCKKLINAKLSALKSLVKSKCHPFKNKFVRIPNPIKKRQKILQRSKQKRVQLNYFIVVGFNKRLSASSSLLFSRVSSLQTSKVIFVFEMVKQLDMLFSYFRCIFTRTFITITSHQILQSCLIQF